MSIYEKINQDSNQELDDLSEKYEVDIENPEIFPNSKVRIKAFDIFGKVLWITDEDIPVVQVGDVKMQIRREGLEKIK